MTTMRYLDLTLEKLIRVAMLAVLMLSLVVATFVWREVQFGSTPLLSSAQSVLVRSAVRIGFGAYHFSRLAYLEVARPVDASSTAEDGPARSVPVLTYHRLTLTDDGSNVTVWSFADQMETLYERGWRTISLPEYEEFIAGTREIPQRSFLITFDDDAEGSYYPTDPILATLGYRAVEYIIVAATEIPGSTYYLSQEQVRAMLRTGRWDIGSHSYDAHRPYPVDPDGGTGVFYADKLWVPGADRLETDAEFAERVESDLVRARDELETVYRVPIDTIAFPFGLEAGIATADNYPAGPSTTIELASKHYSIGWVQTERRDFTHMYPREATFLQHRIHVDHDWDGARLADLLEAGLPKRLPFTDDMSVDQGWLSSWGDVLTGGALVLRARPGETSASSILDGTKLWREYRMDATVDWRDGAVFLLGGTTAARTYRSCAFEAGSVSIQDVTAGTEVTIARTRAPISPEDDSSLGMRIEPGRMACFYDGAPVLSAPVASRVGGIGLQTWNIRTGTASATTTSLTVSPL